MESSDWFVIVIFRNCGHCMKSNIAHNGTGRRFVILFLLSIASTTNKNPNAYKIMVATPIGLITYSFARVMVVGWNLSRWSRRRSWSRSVAIPARPSRNTPLDALPWWRTSICWCWCWCWWCYFQRTVVGKTNGVTTIGILPVTIFQVFARRTVYTCCIRKIKKEKRADKFRERKKTLHSFLLLLLGRLFRTDGWIDGWMDLKEEE